MLKVMEIFHSIDGEGIRAGELTSFIRLAGCNLHCKYCDTAYSINPNKDQFAEWTVDALVNEAKHKNVTVTGGEPLLQPETAELCERLAKLGHSVNVETNGTIIPPARPIETLGEIFYTVDYKCGASGHEKQMKKEAFTNLCLCDVIKCVVGSVEDLENSLFQLRDWIPHLGNEISPWVYFSPVFGKIEPREIVKFMQREKLEGKFRVQLQLHKFIWDPRERMV